MTILKNEYLYTYIVQVILNYFYKYSVSIELYNGHFLSGQSFIYTINETLNYALVSRKWFNYCSNHLNSIMDYNNYKILKYISSSSSSSSSSSIINNNEDYKLIKLNNSIKIYQSFKEYQHDQDIGLIKMFRKVLVQLSFGNDRIDTIEFLRSDKVFPANVEFEIDLDIDGYSDFYAYQFNDYLVHQKNLYRVNIKNDNKLKLEHSKVFQNINKLNSKFIYYSSNSSKYEDEDEDDTDEQFNQNQIHWSQLYQNSTARTIIIDTIDAMEPKDLLLLDNQTTKLKEINLYMKYGNIIKYLNGNDNYKNQLTYPSTFKQDWDKAIQILIGNKTIQHLSITETSKRDEDDYSSDSSDGDDDNNNDTQDSNNNNNNNNNQSYITQGFKLLFSNPSCTIQLLELSGIDFIDDLFIDGLASNNSIKTLALLEMKSIAYIEKILSKNKSISHLVFNNIDVDLIYEFFQILNKQQQQQQQFQSQFNNNNNNNKKRRIDNSTSNNNYYNNSSSISSNNSSGEMIELYSLSVLITNFEYQVHQDKLLYEINNNLYPIKEYNIIILNQSSHLPTQSILNNNSILNIRYN